MEVGNQKSEVGSRKLEVGSRKSEVGSWKLEVGSRKTLLGFRSAFASQEINEKGNLGRLTKSHRLMAPLNHEPSKIFFGVIFKMVLVDSRKRQMSDSS